MFANVIITTLANLPFQLTSTNYFNYMNWFPYQDVSFPSKDKPMTLTPVPQPICHPQISLWDNHITDYKEAFSSGSLNEIP